MFDQHAVRAECHSSCSMTCHACRLPTSRLAVMWLPTALSAGRAMGSNAVCWKGNGFKCCLKALPRKSSL